MQESSGGRGTELARRSFLATLAMLACPSIGLGQAQKRRTTKAARSVWDPWLSKLKVHRDQDSVPLPTRAALDAYEKAAGFKLPESYRQFALRLGPGDLGDDAFRIAAPGYPKSSNLVDLAKMNERFRAGVAAQSDQDLAAKYNSPERVKRLVVFCNTGGGDYYGWDPQDVRNASAHEYGVYVAPRHGNQVEKVGDSFVDFVQNYALGEGYRKRFEDKSLAPRMSFAAAARPSGD